MRWTPCTPCVFWIVIAVATDQPATPTALKTRRSACTPAPPEGSKPAIVSAAGRMASAARHHLHDLEVVLGADHDGVVALARHDLAVVLDDDDLFVQALRGEELADRHRICELHVAAVDRKRNHAIALHSACAAVRGSFASMIAEITATP